MEHTVNLQHPSGKSFTELEVWKKARIIKNTVRELVRTFPADEKFRLVDQLIRSARSVNSNIAEGHGRYTYPDQIHFCIQARGSLSEIYNHCIDANDEHFISVEKLNSLKSEINECERLLNGYINWMRKEIEKQKPKKP